MTAGRLTRCVARAKPWGMNSPEDEATFLRDLVKSARQRTIFVHWKDRDGSNRITALTSAEATQLNIIAQREGVAKEEIMRRAAHVPVAKSGPKPAPKAE